MLWNGPYGHETIDPETGLDIIGVVKGRLSMSGATSPAEVRAILPVVSAVLGVGVISWRMGHHRWRRIVKESREV